MSGTEPNAIDFSKRMIDIQELEKHKETVFKQLSEKDQAIELERQQRLQMEQLLKEMEQKLVQGGNENSEEEE